MSEYNYNEKYFEKIDSEHKAYWLGFLYADGYIEPIYRKEKIKAFRIEIGLSEVDIEILYKFINDIESNVPITKRESIVGDKVYNTCRIRINNTKMCKDLMSLGCVNCKSLTLEFPNETIVPENLLNHFIRGYFDGDGCISYRESKCITNDKEYNKKYIVSSIVGTYNFLDNLKNILNRYDVNFKFNKSSNCGKASEIRLERQYELLNFYNYIYNDATIYLNRKKEKFENAFLSLNIKKSAT